MFYVKGAGKLPADSRIVSDILYITKNYINDFNRKNQFISNN